MYLLEIILFYLGFYLEVLVTDLRGYHKLKIDQFDLNNCGWLLTAAVILFSVTCMNFYKNITCFERNRARLCINQNE